MESDREREALTRHADPHVSSLAFSPTTAQRGGVIIAAFPPPPKKMPRPSSSSSSSSSHSSPISACSPRSPLPLCLHSSVSGWKVQWGVGSQKGRSVCVWGGGGGCLLPPIGKVCVQNNKGGFLARVGSPPPPPSW